MKTLTLVTLLLGIVTRFGTLGQVISEPDDVTICEGGSTTFTCVVNSSISSDDVQWYRLIMDTSTAVMAQDSNIQFTTSTTNNTLTNSLTIANANRSYTGYYWVRLRPSDDVCNVSLTVLTSPPALTVNIMKNTESSSIVVQWDEVDDSLTTTYIVTWTSESDHSARHVTLTEQSSYTITGLTLDTVYTITVTAANTCGQGPEYKANVVLTTATASSTSTTINPTNIVSTNPMTTSSAEDHDTVSTNAIVVTSTTTATTATTTTTTTATSHVTTTTSKIPRITAITTTSSNAVTSTTTTSTAVAVVSSSSITTIMNPITTTTYTTVAETTTTKSSSTTIANPGTTGTTITPVVFPTITVGSRNPTGTASESGDDSSAGYIVGAVIAGIIVLLIIVIIMIYCLAVYRRDRGSYKCKSDVELSGYNNLSSGNGKVPSVLNTLAIYDEQDGEPFKLRTDTSHHSSLTVEPYAMTNVGNSEDFDLNSQPLDVPSSYGKLDPNQMLNTDDRSVPPKPLDPPDSYDKFEPKHAPGADYRSVLQQADGQCDPYKETDDVVHHSDIPALHYAELQLLPPPTSNRILRDDPPVIYAQIA